MSIKDCFMFAFGLFLAIVALVAGIGAGGKILVWMFQ